MNVLFLFLCFAVVVAQLALPRKLAFLPLLVATFHLPNLTVVDLGVNFSITKLLILVGLLRAARWRKFSWSTRQPLDVLIAVWACWAIFSGVFHHPRGQNPLTIRASLVYDIFGTYLYARSFLRNHDDFMRFSRCLAIVLLPLAILMLTEAASGNNVYAALGAPMPDYRADRVRANGPFGHAILAGTTGAACLLLIRPSLHKNAPLAVAGMMACAMIAICSNSSGPLMTLLIVLMGLGFWRCRSALPLVKAAAIVGLISLHLVMEAPVWYLMARIDLTGGSTGYHRAELITQAIDHLHEWWLTGTDYTRHWMPTGVLWSGDHTDLTNYYIKMGVTGGLPLMFLLIILYRKALQLLGCRMRTMRAAREPEEFTLWCIGVTLSAYAFTSVSVSYFDQSFVLWCLLIGIVPGITKKDHSSFSNLENGRSEIHRRAATSHAV